MDHADVVVVGGGPAGSSCAERLVAAGLDVVVVDGARFPRDKPCAGWITPEVVVALRLDLEDYANGNTLQDITRFRVGRIGGTAREVVYDAPVSHGIRRCEFDSYLLRRSGARLRLGERVASLRRDGGEWLVNDSLVAPFLVGAGGHFCPVAHHLDGRPAHGEGVVVAQEMEFRLTPEQVGRCRVVADRPELDFCGDLAGYGWCFRKGEFLNVGLGRRDPRGLGAHVRAYLDVLTAEGRVPRDLRGALHGHAYRVREGPPRRLVGEGVLLAGDAAGLAHPASGEGILPAVVSGQAAAEALLEARQSRDPAALGSYAERLRARLGPPSREMHLPEALRVLAARALLGSSWLARHVVLDRWFLHRAGARC
jgi:geranylgeranyl reductase family protein